MSATGPSSNIDTPAPVIDSTTRRSRLQTLKKQASTAITLLAPRVLRRRSNGATAAVATAAEDEASPPTDHRQGGGSLAKLFGRKKESAPTVEQSADPTVGGDTLAGWDGHASTSAAQSTQLLAPATGADPTGTPARSQPQPQIPSQQSQSPASTNLTSQSTRFLSADHINDLTQRLPPHSSDDESDGSEWGDEIAREVLLARIRQVSEHRERARAERSAALTSPPWPTARTTSWVDHSGKVSSAGSTQSPASQSGSVHHRQAEDALGDRPPGDGSSHRSASSHFRDVDEPEGRPHHENLQEQLHDEEWRARLTDMETGWREHVDGLNMELASLKELLAERDGEISYWKEQVRARDATVTEIGTFLHQTSQRLASEEYVQFLREQQDLERRDRQRWCEAMVLGRTARRISAVPR
ncbi:hypothetical protein HKX48_007628 [Thoreauomyces humboldtii]|nr:hypothetical protein HKX48_007628 [Thoreauomyces humboldtii]